MATKNFILQGLTPKTHRAAIQRLFDVDQIQHVVVSVAFVNLRGVELLEGNLKECAANITAFVGIRNNISTYQGVKRLLDLGVRLHAVDTGSRRVIFHPKIYLVRGATQARMIVGSANLTPGGLNNNIEAGIQIECDLTNPADKELVDGIEGCFADALTDFPQNILRVSTTKQVDALLKSGLLLDESMASPPKPASSASAASGDTTPRIKLKVAPIFSAVSGAKKARNKPSLSGQGKVLAKVAAALRWEEQKAASGVELELVWSSKELTRRDLVIPQNGTATNPTGSINLDKGLLEPDVDHRHYFREEVFWALEWKPKSDAVDEAYAKFQVVVKGVSYGEFDLRVAHTTSTTSRSYLQRNAMTRLSWGEAREVVAKPDLIGRRLSLYRDNANPKKFVLEID